MADPLLHALREALSLVLLLAAPPLLAAAGAGLVMSLIQSALRIEERTLSVVPRIAAGLLALAIAAPWIGAQLGRFMAGMLALVPSLGHP